MITTTSPTHFESALCYLSIYVTASVDHLLGNVNQEHSKANNSFPITLEQILIETNIFVNGENGVTEIYNSLSYE